MATRTRILWTTAAAFGFTACTGATFGERSAGEDTYLEPNDFHDTGDGREVGLGSIGVDPATEVSFVVQAVRTRDEDDTVIDERKTLFAVPPEAEAPSGQSDLTHLSDLRIIFPGDEVVVLGELEGADNLGFLDARTLQTLETLPALDGARYHGTRLSPSKQYLAVCDNNQSPCPIHLIDLATRTTEIIPHDGFWLEAMWLRGSDTLFAVIFYADDQETETDETRARVLSFPMEEVQRCGFAVDAGTWCGRTIDVELPGASPDWLFSFTWLGIAPDDGVVAVPVIVGGQHVVALVSPADGAVRTVDDAHGPVGFTPDGSTVVSYRYHTEAVPCDEGVDPEECPPPETTPQLALIDVEDLTVATIDLPTIEAPEYFVTRTGNLVVVADAWGSGRLVLADLDQGTASSLRGPDVNLTELVSLDDAGELWIADDGLFRVDLVEGLVEQVGPGLSPVTINVLPDHHRLVMDDGEGRALVFFDPETRQQTARATLPLPAPAPGS
ncbi:MAG: hypothetical protein HYS27_05160 [Deltaproteobacteria bacterium]|nr:hypothetical protein [Deltaproteobacteria bacterium]